MIDTDKYEGHTPAPWDKLSEYCPVGSIDKQLIADAPLLLAEVKRLRKDIVSILGAIDLPDYDEFPNTQKELKQMMLDYGQEHLIAEGY